MKEFWDALVRDWMEKHASSVLWYAATGLIGLGFGIHNFIVGNIVSGFSGLFVFVIYSVLIFLRFNGKEKTGEQS